METAVMCHNPRRFPPEGPSFMGKTLAGGGLVGVADKTHPDPPDFESAGKPSKHRPGQRFRFRNHSDSTARKPAWMLDAAPSCGNDLRLVFRGFSPDNKCMK